MQKLLTLLLFLVLCTTTLPAQQWSGPDNAGERVSARGGMVVSASREASRAGAEVLRAGGNAVDAAVAVGFALAVSYPSAGNIGGGCYIIIRMADGREVAIDARETAPAAAHRDMYLDENGEVVTERSLYGPLAAGVPGSVHGLLSALEEFGTQTRSSVMRPALRLAEEGFALHPRLARHFRLMHDDFSRYPHSRMYYTDNGTFYKAGDIWRQPELARTLRCIEQSGSDGFYTGVTADSLVAAMRRDGGIITHEDLSSYKSIMHAPLKGRYRGYDILSMPPSSSGGVVLLQMLGMLEQRALTVPAANDAETAHYMIESMRRAFADRAEFLGDPAFFDIPLQRLLSQSYIDSLHASIDPRAATPSGSLRRSVMPPREGRETTHYSVMDRWGNAVSVTTTINSSFGGLYVVPGAGFLLNNEMDDFSARPGVPNQFGLIGGEANSIQPGKRMLSSMTPTIVVRNDQAVMITGSPGGSTIITTVLHSLLHYIDGGLPVDSVVAAPRFHHQWFPDVTRYEPGAFDAATRAALEAMGHRLERITSMGRCDAIIAYPGRNLIQGCSDPRGYGAAVGIQ